MAHTPGPWTVQKSKYEEHTLFVKTQQPSNRIIAYFGEEELDEEEISNAHVVSAAPELLSVLREINAKYNGSFSIREKIMIMDVIKKAQGERAK